jgi:hypothetical protein
LTIQKKQDRPLWAYGYELTPPVSRERFEAIKALLRAGHEEAELASQVWEGRLINGDKITHVLVVSSTPAQDLAVNERLESEFLRLKAPFTRTTSIEVIPPPRGSGPRRVRPLA